MSAELSISSYHHSRNTDTQTPGQIIYQEVTFGNLVREYKEEILFEHPFALQLPTTDLDLTSSLFHICISLITIPGIVQGFLRLKAPHCHIKPCFQGMNPSIIKTCNVLCESLLGCSVSIKQLSRHISQPRMCLYLPWPVYSTVQQARLASVWPQKL